MAENGSLVTVSGAALSLLLYENVRSFGDQIGFLVGDVVVFVTKNVTDSERQVERVQTHVDVNTVITCPSTDWFCDTVGRVDNERLKDFIRDKRKNIVGWFRFRKNGSLVPTLQDKILHKELRSSICINGTKNHEYFTMCLLNTSVSPMGGTHKFRHVFLRYNNCNFEPISLRINNLGDDSSRPDGSDYKPTPLPGSTSETDVFTKIINTLNLDLVKTPGTELVTRIQKAAESHLDDLIPKLSESDREVANLEKQVRQLEAKIITKKLTSKLTSRDNSYVFKNNSQKEKIESEREKIKIEKEKTDFRLRQEIIDLFNAENQPVKNEPTIQRQSSLSNKQRNLVIQTQKGVNVYPKNVHQDDPKDQLEGDASLPKPSPVRDPFAAVVDVVKMEIMENSPNRDMRSISREPSSSPEFVMAIHNSERNESNSGVGVSRGYGRGSGNRSASVTDANSSSKKARRGKPRVPVSEKSSPSPSSQSNEQEKPKVVAKLEFPVTPSLSYSQAARKSNDVNQIRSSDSQEY